MPFNRQLYKQKPQAYGPPSVVQASIFKNAERMPGGGIDPASIALAMPMWGPGNQIDYAYGGTGTNTGGAFSKNSLTFSQTYAGTDKIALPNTANYRMEYPVVTFVFDMMIPTLVDDTYPAYYAVRDNLTTKINMNGARSNFASISYQMSIGLWGVNYASDNDFLIPNQRHQYVIRSSGTYVNFYKDGIFIKYVPGTTTPSASTIQPSLMNRSTGGRGASGTLYNVTFFSTELPASQIAYLSDNPYFLLQRVAPVFISIPLPLNLTQYAFRFRNDDGYESLQSKAGAVFLRKLYKRKPQAYGPPSEVQYSIFKNAERIGIDPASIALAMPMWGPGTFQDYSKNKFAPTISGAVFTENSFYMDGTDDKFYFADNALWTPTTAMSVFVVATVLTIPPSANEGIISQYTGVNAAGDAYNHRSWALVVTTAGVIRLDLSSTGLYQSANGINGATVSAGQTFSSGFVWEASARNELYVNGTKYSNVTVPASLYNAATELCIGNQYNHVNNVGYNVTALNAKFRFVMLVRDQSLSAGAFADLSDNPYFLLQRVAPVTFSIPKPAATFAAAENTNINLTPGSKTRIRIGINATGDPTSKQFQLEYRRKPSGGSFGDWGIVP